MGPAASARAAADVKKRVLIMVGLSDLGVLMT
jgi:hypothetical protein